MSVYAESTTDNSTVGSSELPPFFAILDEYNLDYYTEYYVLSQKGNDYYLYSLNQPAKVKDNNHSVFTSDFDACAKVYKFIYPNYYLEPERVNLYATGNSYVVGTTIQGSILRSSYDVTTHSGDMVFQNSPLNQQIQVRLKGVLTPLDLTQSLAELIALLPILLPCVVLLIAIRKGLQFTLAMLRAA